MIVSTPAPTLRESTFHDEDRPEPVRLRDGSLVRIRALQRGDETALRDFLGGLSEEARRLRFFGGGIDTDRAAHSAADMSGGRYGLVAEDETGEILGHALFIVLENPTHAEVAVEIADRLHGCGLGTLLIERLAMIAERRGVTHFVAEVLCENRAMLDVFREGFDARVVRREGPEERVEFLTSGWRLARERFATDSAAAG